VFPDKAQKACHGQKHSSLLQKIANSEQKSFVKLTPGPAA
jgi:hypothetical protein